MRLKRLSVNRVQVPPSTNQSCVRTKRSTGCFYRTILLLNRRCHFSGPGRTTYIVLVHNCTSPRAQCLLRIDSVYENDLNVGQDFQDPDLLLTKRRSTKHWLPITAIFQGIPIEKEVSNSSIKTRRLSREQLPPR